MLCDNCHIDKQEKDFINNQKFCYQCEYKLKIKKIAETRKEDTHKCRTCGKHFVLIENLKKRQRSYFCSEACAKLGHKAQLNNHWTRKIRKETYR